MKGKDYRKGEGGAHVIRAADLPLSDCTCGLMVAGIERCIILGAEGRAVVLERCFHGPRRFLSSWAELRRALLQGERYRCPGGRAAVLRLIREQSLSRELGTRLRRSSNGTTHEEWHPSRATAGIRPGCRQTQGAA